MKFTSLGLSDDLLEASKQVLQNSKEYEDFFKASLKKFGVSSPADFKSDEEKKKFFDYIEKNYKGEKSEEAEVKEKAKPAKKFIKLGDNAEKKNLTTEKLNPKKQEQIIDLYNKLMDVKHGGSEFKKIKAQIAKLQKEDISESSRAYFKQIDDLTKKHGEEEAFMYKSPNLNKMISDLKKVIASEVKAGFKDSKKYGDKVIKHLQKMEVMVYNDNVVMTNNMHGKFSNDWNGDTAFREDMASVIIKHDDILAHAIFGV